MINQKIIRRWMDGKTSEMNSLQIEGINKTQKNCYSNP